MNVAILSDYICNNYISGQTVFTKRLIEGIAEHVEKVFVITVTDRSYISGVGNITYYCLKGYHLKRFYGAHVSLNPFSAYRKIFSKEKIDIIHVQVPTPISLAAIYAARKRSIPIVFSSHVQADNVLKNMKINSSAAKRILSRYGIWFYNCADHVVCPSQYAKSELFHYGLKKGKEVSVISNGINTQVFSPNGKGKPVVLYVGRLMREKNVDTFIKASALVKRAHPDYSFVVCGDGFIKSELQELAGRINPDVFFTGRLSDEELLGMYQTCSIFVLPSETELQGIVLLEAMACGKPTIASDSQDSAARELANLLFRNRDTSDLARQINYLIENPQVMRAFSNANRETAIKQHDFSQVVQRHLNLYQDLIKENRKNSSL